MAVNLTDRLYANIMLLMQSCRLKHEPVNEFDARLKRLAPKLSNKEHEVIVAVYQLDMDLARSGMAMQWYVERTLEEPEVEPNYNLNRLLWAYYRSASTARLR
jgi:ribosomal protein S7